MVPLLHTDLLEPPIAPLIEIGYGLMKRDMVHEMQKPRGLLFKGLAADPAEVFHIAALIRSARELLSDIMCMVSAISLSVASRYTPVDDNEAWPRIFWSERSALVD